MGNPFGGGGSDAAEQAARERREQERKRRRRIQQGTQSIEEALAPFNDDFFQSRQEAFVQNATPELDDRFSDARRNLVFALSRGGLLQSSEAARRQRQLQQERDRFEQQIASRGAEFANQGRQNLERTRSDLLGQLQSTEDPAMAAESAARRAELLSAPPDFPALGNFTFNTARELEQLSNRSTGGRGFLSSPITSNIRSAGSGSGRSRIVSA